VREKEGKWEDVNLKAEELMTKELEREREKERDRWCV
jgi:hypothetical protein